MTLKKELVALLGQVEMAWADTVIEFKASQPFIDTCIVYYSDGFEDCLKQVKSVYPHLDLSKVTMDDPLPSNAIGDTIFKETDDSSQSKRDPKNNGVILAQPVVEKLVTPLIMSTKAQDAENLSTQGTRDPPFKDNKNPLA